MRFNLGVITHSEQVRALLSEYALKVGVMNHAKGDWGLLDKGLQIYNERVLERGFPVNERIVSLQIGNGGLKFYVITERSNWPGEIPLRTRIILESEL